MPMFLVAVTPRRIEDLDPVLRMRSVPAERLVLTVATDGELPAAVGDWERTAKVETRNGAGHCATLSSSASGHSFATIRRRLRNPL